jgi:uncharacterized membrane protein
MRNAFAYAVSLVTFLGADMVWLGVMAPRFYRPILGDIALSGVNLPAAIAFYGLYPIGLVMFAVLPALKAEQGGTALLLGATYGFFTYATYDLTNNATLRNWSVWLTVVDMAWGTILAGVTASVAFWVVSRFA